MHFLNSLVDVLQVQDGPMWQYQEGTAATIKHSQVGTKWMMRSYMHHKELMACARCFYWLIQKDI